MAENFRVVTQAPNTIIDASGQVAPIQEVTIETIPSGIVAKLRIPIAMFTPDEVLRQGTAQAKVIEAVQAL